MVTNNINHLLIDLYHKGDFGVSNSGDIQRVKGLENIKQAVLHRLITPKGSLAHKPDYGIGIQRYKGVTLSLEVKRAIALDIKEIELDDRITELTQVSFYEDDSVAGGFYIYVIYNVIGIGSVEQEVNPFEVKL